MHWSDDNEILHKYVQVFIVIRLIFLYSLWPSGTYGNIDQGSGNDLLPDGTKPLPEPIWTKQ